MDKVETLTFTRYFFQLPDERWITVKIAVSPLKKIVLFREVLIDGEPAEITDMTKINWPIR